MRKKIKEIAEGWKNVIVTDVAVNAIADARLKICYTCPNKISMLGMDTCSLCHCPLIAKTKSPESVCPAGKWKEQITKIV